MEEQTLFLVYETDAWHSRHSSSLCGVFTSKESAIEAVVEHHKIPYQEFRDYFDDDEPFDCVEDEYIKEQINGIIRVELNDNNQTQSFSVFFIMSLFAVSR